MLVFVDPGLLRRSCDRDFFCGSARTTGLCGGVASRGDFDNLKERLANKK